MECSRNSDGQAGAGFRLGFKRHRLFSFPEQVESAKVVTDVVSGIVVSAAQKTVGDPDFTNISQGYFAMVGAQFAHFRLDRNPFFMKAETSEFGG